MENLSGFFGSFGGAFVSKELEVETKKINQAYTELKQSAKFIKEMQYIRRTYQGRPTPITHARNLSKKIGGAQIYLKREDLNHTGSHKLNHCIGEVLLAKHMNKRKVIAETGAGQHGVALASAASYMGLECEIHMGENDIIKEKPNVLRMKLLGCKIVPVTTGQKSLKEAVDSAFNSYIKDMENSIYCIGSVVGPHPFPSMIRDYQSIIGVEAREQIIEQTNRLPDAVIACVGGGSNAMGIFSGFLNDNNVKLYGVEPLGKGNKLGQHASTIAYGKEAIIHGFKSLVLLDEHNNPAPVYSIASGLDYPAIGPEHAYLNSIKRATYVQIDDKKCLEAFYILPKTEGIIPALESSHALAYAMKLAKDLSSNQQILVNLSGRGDKDLEFISDKYGI